MTSPYTPRLRMAFSPDGKRLAGNTVDGEFSVLDAETGRLVWKFETVKLPQVDDFSFRADGKYIHLTCRTSPILETRNAETGKIDRVEDSLLTLVEGIETYAVSPDLSKAVLIRSIGKRPVILAPMVGAQITELGTGGSRVAYGSDGKHFAVAWTGEKEVDRRVTIHNVKGEVLHTLEANAKDILAFTPDGKYLVAASQDGATTGRTTFSRWDVTTGAKLGSFTLPGFAVQNDLVLSPDGKTLARRFYEAFLDLWDTETGKPRYTNAGPHSSVGALAFSPDGKYLASSNRYDPAEPYDIRLWDLATAREVATWKTTSAHRLAFSPDGKLLVRSTDQFVYVHRVPDGQELHMLESKGAGIESITFSPDGSLFAAVGSGDSIRVWRASDGKLLRILAYPNTVWWVLFSPDGSRLYVAGFRGIKIWETQSGLEIKYFLEDSNIDRIEWLPDGKTLAAFTSTAVWHLDPESGTVLRKIPVPARAEAKVIDSLLSPGARFLAKATTHGFSLTQPGSVPERHRLFRLSPSRATHEIVDASVAFSPDGRYLACGNSEGVISLLRLSEKGKLPELQIYPPTAKELAGRPNGADTLKSRGRAETARKVVTGGDAKHAPKELVAVLGETQFRVPHAGQLTHPRALRYSPDGKLLAAVASNGFADVYEVATGRVLLSFRGGADRKLAFAPDNRRVAVSTVVETWKSGTCDDGKRLRDFANKTAPGA